MRTLKRVAQKAARPFTAKARIARIAEKGRITPKQVLARARAMRMESNAGSLVSRLRKLEAEESYLDRMLRVFSHSFKGTEVQAAMKAERTKAIEKKVEIITELERIRKAQSQRKK